MAVQELSHAIGPTDIPILSETIGANFRSVVQRFPDGEGRRHLGQRQPRLPPTRAQLRREPERHARTRRGTCRGNR